MDEQGVTLKVKFGGVGTVTPPATVPADNPPKNEPVDEKVG